MKSQPPAWFGPALARAQRIDAYTRIKVEVAAGDTPIFQSVLEDMAYARPPFENINDHVGQETQV